MQQVEGLRVLPFVGRPEDQRGGDPVLSQHVVRALRSVERIALVVQELGCIEHVDLLLVAAGGEQDGALGDAVADGEHGLQYSLVRIITEATDFTRTHHVDAEHRVGLLQASEGEL